ncbi:MAG: hypothetical protein NW220_24455 [Leptolyngbyaceae cyanobacterium bins.349]|nr:hypothetical protein [Leptolyngbyaceae cyanobacterium bins.349]
MASDTLAPKTSETETKVKASDRALAAALLITRIRNSIWIFGIPSWLFGITDRSLAAFADGYLSPIEIFQLVTASLFFLSWLVLKPEPGTEEETMPTYHLHPVEQMENAFAATQKRMQELQRFHLIRQEYVLPFPYLAQIYHLLNLKHLEDIHSFSLNNLRVIQVSDFQKTAIGGVIKFQTVLESSLNALRMWRQPVVEVDLILHNLYTIELSIPVYADKRIAVLFNVFPVSETEHKLFIDIYSDLGWFKPLLQLPLHIASCLTLLEDWSYLQALSDRNLDRLVKSGKVSSHETMQLFQRFVDLYGPRLNPENLVDLLPTASRTTPPELMALPYAL